MTILQVQAKTKLFLIIEIVTKILGLTILFTTFMYGFMYLMIGLLLQQLFQLIITSILINRLCFNNNFSQIKIVAKHVNPFVAFGGKGVNRFFIVNYN